MRNYLFLFIAAAALQAQSGDFQTYIGKQVYTKSLIGTLNEQLRNGVPPSDVSKSLNDPDRVPIFKVTEVEKTNEGGMCKLVVVSDGREVPYSTMPCDELVTKDGLRLGEKVQADIAFRGNRKGIAVDFNLKNVNCDIAANVCSLEASIVQTAAPSLELYGHSDTLSVTAFDERGKAVNNLIFIRPSGTLAIPKKVSTSITFVGIDAMVAQTTFGFLRGLIETAENPKKAKEAAKKIQKLYKGKLQLSIKSTSVDLTAEVIMKTVPAYVY